MPLPAKRAEVIHGDCLEVMRAMPDASVDAVVTDPPAGIAFMNKDWDRDRGGRTAWVAWLTTVMRECLRVLKPGGHAVVWALPRTSHWTAWAIEDAGFELRDCGPYLHIFGSGFPKSMSVDKAIDKAAGAKREVVAPAPYARGRAGQSYSATRRVSYDYPPQPVTAPATPEAARWSGWGTALKPAVEFWWLARRPLAGTVAANVTQHGTGALNIDGCRIGTSKDVPASMPANRDGHGRFGKFAVHGGGPGQDPNVGRWPANLVLDQGAADLLDQQAGDRGAAAPVKGTEPSSPILNTYGDRVPGAFHGDAGGPSRFFYTAKSSRSEREYGLSDRAKATTSDGRKKPNDTPRQRGETLRGNTHPTVKPVDLMQWLVRLVTPPGGTVLDPFCGSGSTGMACVLEGFQFVGIEADATYCDIARGRIAPLLAGAKLEQRDTKEYHPRQVSLLP